MFGLGGMGILFRIFVNGFEFSLLFFKGIGIVFVFVDVLEVVLSKDVYLVFLIMFWVS